MDMAGLLLPEEKPFRAPFVDLSRAPFIETCNKDSPKFQEGVRASHISTFGNNFLRSSIIH